MTTTPTQEDLDQATIDLVFALRDSLTDVSRLDFWSGRCTTAIETAAAGATDMPQAITIACQKLQIPTLTKDASAAAVRIADSIGDHYEAWAGHVSRSLVYLIALARVENDARKAPRKTATAVANDAAPIF